MIHKQRGKNKYLRKNEIEDKIIRKIDRDKIEGQGVRNGLQRFVDRYRKYFQTVSTLN